MFKRYSQVAVAAALLLGCAPETVAPVEVVVLVFNTTSNRYEPKTVQLKTVADLVEMRGSAAKIIGQSEFSISGEDPALQAATTAEEAIEAIRKDKGDAVKVSYLENDGVLIPADFHSLNIATTYYNFEKVFDLYKRVGDLTPEQYGTPTVYYFPEFFQEEQLVEDNAAFMPLLNSFFIYPFNELQQVPLSINAGVVGHEFSHGVFFRQMFGGQINELGRIRSSWGETLAGGTPGLNLLDSLDEGTADLFGTAVTCDTQQLTNCVPTFFSHSMPNEYAMYRRLDTPQCMTESLAKMLTDMGTDFSADGHQYQVGSVFSSAMWKASEHLGGTAEARLQMYQVLYSVLGRGQGQLGELMYLSQQDQTQFSLASGSGSHKGVLDRILDAASNPKYDPKLKEALCSAFMDRFHLPRTAMRSCPATARSFGDCVY